MTNKTLSLNTDLYHYLLNHSLRESPVLANLRQVTAGLPGSMMQIAPEQGQFMALLVKLIQARKTLDIGTFTGYSALVVAEALPPAGRVISCDIDEKSTAIAQQFWQQAGLDHKIDLRLAPALITLQHLIDTDQVDSFDFVFIDADKNNYQHYYEKALILTRPGGVIAIDNVLWDGKVADAAINDPATQGIRVLNAQLHQDPRIDLSLLPLADGLTLARKR